MALAHFFKGSPVRSWVRFVTSSNVLVDPTGVTCEIRNPAGTETSYAYGTDAELVKSETGVYYLVIDTADYSGEYRVRWTGTGTNAAVVDGTFYVYSLFDGEKQYGGQ